MSHTVHAIGFERYTITNWWIPYKPSQEFIPFPHLLLIPWVTYPPVPPPDQPTIDMDSIKVTSNSITLSWSVDKYVTSSEVVWRASNGGVTTKADGDEGTSGRITDSTYTIGGLKSDTEYTITVTVVNPAGSMTGPPITRTTEKGN